MSGASLPKSWTVPEAAYVRSWGLAGPGPCSPIGDQECATGVSTGLRGLAGGISVPGLGVPLGGVGAGSFQYNLFGTFGPWNMGGSQSSDFWEMRTLPQGAFHVREAVEAADPTVWTLATRHDNIAPQRNFGGVCSAWNQLSPGDGTYAALYPFGWTSYDVFESDVSMRFWSPIVAGEDERTSLPVAFFDLELANPTDRVIDLSVMFTFANATSHAEVASGQPATTRDGLYSRFENDVDSGVSGVTLGSDSPANTDDAYKSEWTIAALPASDQELTYVTSWDGAGDGSDVYGAFTPTGRLPNRPLDDSSSAGAVALAVQLSPGQRTTVRFALSWDFPQVYFGQSTVDLWAAAAGSDAGTTGDGVTGEGTWELSNGAPGQQAVWMRRYTEFLGATCTDTNDYMPDSYPFQQAFTIASRELARHDDTLARVESWWRPIAENETYPVWLRMAALNELYELVFNASFWEAGLVSSTIPATPGGPRLGAEIPGTHLFWFIDAGSGGAGANEMDMDSAGYLAYTKLFPNIELGRIRAWLQLVKQNPIGRVPQQILPGTGPYIGATAGIQNEPPDSPNVFGEPPADSDGLGELFEPSGGNSFRDCAHKLIHRTFALYQETGDEPLPMCTQRGSGGRLSR